MKAVKTALVSLTTALLLMTGSSSGLAGDKPDHDHDRARQALEAGEILPLRSILERVERDNPGQVMEVELERKPGGRWIYEIKLLRTGGALVKLRVDARDGSLLDSKTRDAAPGSPRSAGGNP
jgi:uncharacterized membrane protein YkoI